MSLLISGRDSSLSPRDRFILLGNQWRQMATVSSKSITNHLVVRDLPLSYNPVQPTVLLDSLHEPRFRFSQRVLNCTMTACTIQFPVTRSNQPSHLRSCIRYLPILYPTDFSETSSSPEGRSEFSSQSCG